MTEHIHRTQPPLDHVPVTKPPKPATVWQYVVVFVAIMFALAALAN